MPVVKWFDGDYTNTNEQRVWEDLIGESIRVSGINVWYLPRNLNNKDPLYTADDISDFTSAYLIEMYLKSTGFEGMGSFMSPFGNEIQDQVTFTVAKRAFDQWVGSNSGLIRPREGDLIYFPLNHKAFEIKYADQMPYFYQMGRLQIWDLHCELYQYSSEHFSTGIPEIDSIQPNHSLDIFDRTLRTEDGKYLVSDDGMVFVDESWDIKGIDTASDDNVIQIDSTDIFDFDEMDPFQDGNY